jgi:hypothetical protein
MDRPLTAREKVQLYARDHGLSMSKYWPIQHLADLLDIDIKTADRWIKSRQLRGILKTSGQRKMHPDDIVWFINGRTAKFFKIGNAARFRRTAAEQEILAKVSDALRRFRRRVRY